MNRTIVTYETFHGSAKRVAETIAAKLNCKYINIDTPFEAEDLREIQNLILVFNFRGPYTAQLTKLYLSRVKDQLKNKNMILIKRVPAKSDPRFVNAGIYLAAQLPQYRYISTHNKINYIDTGDADSEMCARLTYGLFALLNSTIYDRYISIISKSKQINSKELRSLPLPPRNIIENIGVRLMSTRLLTVEACDSVVNPTLHIIVK